MKSSQRQPQRNETKEGSGRRWRRRLIRKLKVLFGKLKGLPEKVWGHLLDWASKGEEDEPHPLTQLVFGLGSPIDQREEELGDLIERYREKRSAYGSSSKAQQWAWKEAVANFKFGPRRNLYLLIRCLFWLSNFLPWIAMALNTK